MDDIVLDRLARYFRALSEPQRLKILDLLRSEAMNVGELTQRLGCSQANVSKHLALMTEAGLVEREPRGTSVYYRFADPEVYQLCDLVRKLERQRPTGRAASRPAQAAGNA
jgi:DNA-binding transcriptional ArsR family regulator